MDSLYSVHGFAVDTGGARRCRVIPVVDGHVDLVCFLKEHFPQMPFSEMTQGDITPQQLEDGNVRVFISVFHCPDSENGPGTATAFLSGLLAYANRYLADLPVLNTPKNLHQVMDGIGPPAIIPLLENADALLEWDLLDLWHRGFRAVGLTHSGANRIGDGSHVANPAGLSSKGKALVRRLSEGGFIIDVAHLSEPAFEQVARLTSGALMVSYTGLRHFCDVPHNLSDKQVTAIIERGGVIGVALAPWMLASDRQAGVSEVFAHIDWLVQKYGPDQVALGSDFGGFKERCDGLENPGCFQRLTEVLEYHGYPHEDIAKIMGRNWSEFYALHLDHCRFLDRPPQ